MTSKLIRIDSKTYDMVEDCINDFIRHHPEFKEVPISKNKIIYEIAKFYLKH